MDIVTIAEATSLKLTYDRKEVIGQKLRQDVLRTLKMTKPPRNNLTTVQRKAIKELKSDDNIKIFPFDKGAGLVRITNESSLEKNQRSNW